MSFELKKIWEGVRNSYFPPEELKQKVFEVAAERVAICNVCPSNSANRPKNVLPLATCMECGCNIKWKTHSLSASCPIGKWSAVPGFTDDDSNEIDIIIGND